MLFNITGGMKISIRGMFKQLLSSSDRFSFMVAISPLDSFFFFAPSTIEQGPIFQNCHP